MKYLFQHPKINETDYIIFENMTLKPLFFLFLFTIIIKNGFSQGEQKYFFSTELGVGSMVIPENKTLLNDFIPSIDISIAKSMQGRTDEWIRRMNVSYQLVTFTYMNQSNLNGIEINPIYLNAPQTNSFGNVYMLTYSLMIKLLGKEKNQFHFIPGWGIAYDTKTFYNDMYNIYIGSHLNYAIRVEGMYTRTVSEKTIGMLGIKYMHYSNGSLVLPNRGINSVSFKIGLAYQFTRK